jgi:manganese/zinc/iron transport system substrate-binding protein
MTFLKVRVCSLLFFVFLCSCGRVSEKIFEDLSSRTILAVATTGMIADIVQNVGGNRIELTRLMGAGVDPHLYKASEGDVMRMMEADIIFYNGLHLEGALSHVLDRVGTNIRTAAVTDGIEDSLLLSPPGFEKAHDPHVWFDVDMWMLAVEYVRGVFAELDPSHENEYYQNARIYLAALRDLDDYVKSRSSSVPPERRVLITAHDAFNYFGRAYGFEVRGLQGISTATEAGTADVQQLTEFIVSRQIPAIFVESSVPQRRIEAVKAAVKARRFSVGIGGELFSDAMGNAGTPEGTYIGMVQHNIDTIVEALLAE